MAGCQVMRDESGSARRALRCAAVETRRDRVDSTLESLGIVHARVGSTERVMGAMFRMLERQRRRGR